MKYLLMLLFGLLVTGPLFAQEAKVQEPEAVVEAFTFCLAHDNWKGARFLMDKRMYEITRSEEFFAREAEERLPMLLSNQGATLIPGSKVTGDRALVKAMVVANNNRVFGVVFILRKEKGLWKMDNIMYSALGWANPV